MREGGAALQGEDRLMFVIAALVQAAVALYWLTSAWEWTWRDTTFEEAFMLFAAFHDAEVLARREAGHG